MKSINIADSVYDDIILAGLGWERPDPARILSSSVREHFRLHYVASGTGWLETSKQNYCLTGGSGFIIFPGDASNYYPSRDDPWEYFWMGIKGTTIENLVMRAGITRAAPIFHITSTKDETRQLLTNMCISPIIPESLSYNFQHYLYEFFQNIVPFDKAKSSKSYYIERCLDYIHKNYSNDISIQNIANNLAIDRTYLYKLFKSYLNTSPQAYLIDHRIAKACDLLQSTTKSIIQIAYAVGFNDLSDFSRQFKKRHKISPSQYRTIDATINCMKKEND